MQTIEIHSRKPRFFKKYWWTVLKAAGNHEPLMSSEVLESEEAALNNADLVAVGKDVRIVRVEH